MIRHSHDILRHRFTREDYHRMAETGILHPRARVELLDGEIVEMSPIGPRHSAIVDRLSRYFNAHASKNSICRAQGSISLFGESEPEPDVVLLKYRDDFYEKALPTPDDVMLIVEVAESSRGIDLGAKLRLYAESKIIDYWVVDLTADTFIVHRDPVDDHYASVTVHEPHATIAPIALPDVSVRVDSILFT
jgi:Uma2 family endonuclease